MNKIANATVTSVKTTCAVCMPLFLVCLFVIPWLLFNGWDLTMFGDAVRSLSSDQNHILSTICVGYVLVVGPVYLALSSFQSE